MKTPNQWNTGLLVWYEAKTVFASIVFTWQLPTVRKLAAMYADRQVIVGGPAVESMPGYFLDVPNVSVGEPILGILQQFNRNATRTSKGCNNRCSFCSAWRREGRLVEFEDWPDLPVLVDNNLLQCSLPHFDRVINKLKAHGEADFNQGIDPRCLTQYHAGRIAEIPKVMVRLALDSLNYTERWEAAFAHLRTAGIPKSRIRSYALIGETTGPDEAWERCEWIDKHRVKVLPMWFHEEKTLEHNVVTKKQRVLGWTGYERRRLFQWWYKHKKAVKGTD